MYKLFTIITFFLFISCEQHLNNSDTAIDIKENKPAEDVYNYPETVLGITLGEPYEEDALLKNNEDILLMDSIDKQPCYILFSQDLTTYKWYNGTLNIPTTSVVAFPSISVERNMIGEEVVNNVSLSISNTNLGRNSSVENKDNITTTQRIRRVLSEDLEKLIAMYSSKYGNPNETEGQESNSHVLIWKQKDLVIQLYATLDNIASNSILGSNFWEVNIHYKFTYEKNKEVFGTQQPYKSNLI